MTDLAALRDEWARVQREPIDQYWVGPGAFVERLLTVVEEQQRAIESLRTVFAPFLSDTPTHGFLQVEAARNVWLATAKAPPAAPDWNAIALQRARTR